MRPLWQLFWLDLGVSYLIVLLNIFIPYFAKDYFKLFAIMLFPFYLALLLGVVFGIFISKFYFIFTVKSKLIEIWKRKIILLIIERFLKINLF